MSRDCISLAVLLISLWILLQGSSAATPTSTSSLSGSLVRSRSSPSDSLTRSQSTVSASDSQTRSFTRSTSRTRGSPSSSRSEQSTTHTATVTPAPTPTPSGSGSRSATSVTRPLTQSRSSSLSVSPTTLTPPLTFTRSNSLTQTRSSLTPQPLATASMSPGTPTATQSFTATPTLSKTPSESRSATRTSTHTNTSSFTRSRSKTPTPSESASESLSETLSGTDSRTSNTLPPLPTESLSLTISKNSSRSVSASLSRPSASMTHVSSESSSVLPTHSNSSSMSFTPSMSEVASRTLTLKETRSKTLLSSVTRTLGLTVSESETTSSSLTTTQSMPTLTKETSLSATDEQTATRTLRLSATRWTSTFTESLEIVPYGSPCPVPPLSMNLSVYPSTSLTPHILRTQSIIFFLNLTHNYRWLPSATGAPTFAPVFTGSQPERLGWTGRVVPVCVRLSTEVMRCETKPVWDYDLLIGETIAMSVPGAVLQTGCNAPSFVPVTLEVTTDTPALVTAARSLTVVLGIVAFIGSWIGSQAAVYDAQLLVFVGQSFCGTVLDKYMTWRLLYLLAPLADYGAYAILYGNLSLMLIFCVCHAGITILYAQRRDIPFNDACEVMAFPGLSYCCIVYLHGGVCYGTIQLALNEADEGAGIGSSLPGFAYMLLLPTLVFYLLFRHVHVTYVEYGIRKGKPPLQRFVTPIGFWDPKQPRRMFGRMLSTVGSGRILYIPYQLIVVAVVAIVASVRPTTEQGCVAANAILSSIVGVAAILVALWRPHRVHLENVITVFVFLLLAVQCAVQAVPNDHLSPSLGPEYAKAGLWLAQLFVVTLRCIFDAVILLWETFRWRQERSPAFGILDEDRFAMNPQRLEDPHEDDAMVVVLDPVNAEALSKRAASRSYPRRSSSLYQSPSRTWKFPVDDEEGDDDAGVNSSAFGQMMHSSAFERSSSSDDDML